MGCKHKRWGRRRSDHAPGRWRHGHGNSSVLRLSMCLKYTGHQWVKDALSKQSLTWSDCFRADVGDGIAENEMDYPPPASRSPHVYPGSNNVAEAGLSELSGLSG
jgi:hypothetical protein